MRYKGWEISDGGEGYHPITGRWRATRHGVGMGHPTRDGLIRMIDAREADGKTDRERLDQVLGFGHPGTTSINGQPAEWTREIWEKWYTHIDVADPKLYDTHGKVTTANYWTPRPPVDEYNRGSLLEGFTFTIGGWPRDPKVYVETIRTHTPESAKAEFWDQGIGTHAQREG